MILKLCLNKLLNILFFLAPFPLFYDFAEFSFLINFPEDLIQLVSLNSAMPISISFITLAILLLYNFLYSAKYVFDSNIILNIVFIIYIILIGIMSNFPILRLLQAISVLFLVAFLKIPTSYNIIRNYSIYYFFGLFTFVNLYVVSIWLNNDFSIFDVNRYNFGLFYGLQIYQSLVSFPATLFLQIVFCTYLFLRIKKHRFIIFETTIVLYYLAMISQTRMSVAESFVIILLYLSLLLSSLYAIRNYIIKSKYLVTYYQFIIFIIFLFVFNINFNLSEIKTASGDRFILINDGLTKIFNNYLTGSGDIHSGAHNYFIDVALSLGVFNGLFILIFLLFNIFSLIIRYYNKTYFNHLFLLALTMLMLLNSIFNSALTQAIYISNYFLILFFLFPQKHFNNKP